jgi:hypothetical protein
MPFIGKELRAIADRNKDNALVEYLRVITPQWMKDTLGVRGNAQQTYQEQSNVNHPPSDVNRRFVTGTGLGGSSDVSVVNTNTPPPPPPPNNPPLNPPHPSDEPPPVPPDDHTCDIDLVIYMAPGWGRWDWDTVTVLSSLGLTLAAYDRNDATPPDIINGPGGSKIHFVAVNVNPPNYVAYAKVLTINDDGTCSRTQTPK